MCNGTFTVNLLEPNTVYEGRMNQLDLRATKVMRFGGPRLQISFDVYNVFNSNAIRAVNTRYGADWLRPTAIQSARLLKFGAQFDF